MDLVGLIVWLVIGGVVGWLASLVMRTDAQQGILLNIVVGIVGAFIGGRLLGLVPSSVLLPLLAVILLISAVKVWRHA